MMTKFSLASVDKAGQGVATSRSIGGAVRAVLYAWGQGELDRLCCCRDMDSVIADCPSSLTTFHLTSLIRYCLNRSCKHSADMFPVPQHLPRSPTPASMTTQSPEAEAVLDHLEPLFGASAEAGPSTPRRLQLGQVTTVRERLQDAVSKNRVRLIVLVIDPC